MWLDIFKRLEANAKEDEEGIQQLKHQVWQLETEPKNALEVRLCVLSGDDWPDMDFEGTNDAYIKVYIENPDGTLQICETDTHYRCNNGKPSFNYRLKFNIETPLPDT